jgi:hypothetical protein
LNINVNYNDATTHVSERPEASEETWHEDERSSLLQTNVAGFTESWHLTEINDISRQNADHKDLFNGLPFLRETVAAIATLQ